MGAGASTKRAPVDGAEVERIFKDIDKNSDGVLTVTECARGIAAPGPAAVRPRRR